MEAQMHFYDMQERILLVLMHWASTFQFPGTIFDVPKKKKPQ